MPSPLHISSAEFASHLTPEQLRPGMIIQAGLGLGALFFFGVVLLLASANQSKEVEPDALDLLSILTVVELAIFTVLSTVGNLLYRSRLTSERIQSALAQDILDRTGNPINATPAEKILSLIRTAMIIRTALFEGSAYFGLAVLLIAATHGVLLTTPWVWVNMIPVVSLFVLIFVTFPTSARVQHIFETNILHAT